MKSLDEQIIKMKKLSLINEDDMKTDYNTQNQVDDAMDTDEFEAGVEKTLQGLLSNVSKDIYKLGNQVGDRDGTLELQGESIEINEVGLAMGASIVLAAPKVIEMIGKGTRQLGISTKSEWIRSAGEAATKAGKKLHHSYGSIIMGLLRKIPKYAQMPEQAQRNIANGIILSATVAAGIASVNGVIDAMKAGEAGIAAVESGLSGVKGIEVGNAARTILPNILNGFFK